MLDLAVNIAVENVRASSCWYQELLGCVSSMDPKADHRELFDLLCDSEGRAVVILSKWDHNPLPSLNDRPNNPGKGVVLFFTSDAFDRAWEFAKENAEVLEESHPSRGFEIPEFTVVDRDGYIVTVGNGASA